MANNEIMETGTEETGVSTRDVLIGGAVMAVGAVVLNVLWNKVLKPVGRNIKEGIRNRQTKESESERE